MTEEDLGKLSTHELDLVVARCLADHLEPLESVRQELEERNVCYHDGKAGVSPVLSRRVVAVAESKLIQQLPETGGMAPGAQELAQHFRLHCETWNDAIRAYSAFLRGEGEFVEDTPSPLEDES